MRIILILLTIIIILYYNSLDKYINIIDDKIKQFRKIIPLLMILGILLFGSKEFLVETLNKSNIVKPVKVKRNVTATMKKIVASRQKWHCKSCKNVLDETYEVDHIIPLYTGGGNNIENLQALCPNCHRKKTIMQGMNLLL